jgi:hypothetical protein
MILEKPGFLFGEFCWMGKLGAAGIPSSVTSAHFIFFRRWLILSLWFLASSTSIIA